MIQSGMPTSKRPSAYNLLKGSFEFTDEPLWFRLVLCIGLLLFYIVVVVALSRYALPVIVVRWIERPPVLQQWLSGKGRLP